MPRIRLLARCQINGAVHEAGEIVNLPDGQLGPHRTRVASNHGAQISANRYTGDAEPDANYGQQIIYDEPLYVLLDEGVEKERAEMHARHAEERAKLNRDPERNELLKKQAHEQADMEIKAREAELTARHKREDEALKSHHGAEVKAFDKRAEHAPSVPPPLETDKEGLEARHKAELEIQEKRHAEETRLIEVAKEQRKQREETAEHPDKAAEVQSVEKVDAKAYADPVVEPVHIDPPPVRDPPPNPPLPHPAPPKMPV